jgi:hypothetical protein
VRLFGIVKPLVWLLIFATLPLVAQPKPSPIKLEDPELYFAFFRAHDALNHTIQSSTAATASQITAANASLYNISVADFPKLTAEVEKFMANLAAWQGPEQAYVNQQRAAKKLPDPKILVNYQWQRQRLVLNAYGGIHNALTTPSWTGLYGYINGAFRTSQSQGKGSSK